jgi:hypothetical protein
MFGQHDHTRVAFWHQAEPYQDVALQSFAERTAPTRAADK